VDIVAGEPELIVKKKGERLTLEFSPKITTARDIIIVKETPTKLKVIEITSDHQRIATILGDRNRLEVPANASEQVLAAISGVSPIVTVHSDIGGGLETAREVPATPQPHVHLLPAGNGLKASLLCRPFGEVGSYYRPGKGGSTVIAEIDGERLQTSRDLKTEQKLAEAVLQASTILSRYNSQDGEWLIHDPEDCLQLLLELQELGEKVIIEWPEGEKLRISHKADFSQFQMQIRSQNNWFEANGELKLDENLVLDLQNLMELLEKTPGRFLPLGDNQFLALTQQFRQRLDELKNFGTKKGKGLQFHPLTSLVLEDAIADMGDIQADEHWQTQVRKIQEMKDLQPQLPSTLQAELRDYQQEGFEWLSRLAHWGVGACLADQMGLGKTLQALALILTQAPNGPTLIIAPTSVCGNWISEAQKFTPTLNPIQFSSRDRQATLDALQPFDLFVCSYGLLQQEDVSEMLANVQWQTIVLDEAQAIKNTATKRSQAAMKLQSQFKLITTGTPIENHLGELWNLFHFINPGLLGSWEQFNQRFASPIERQQDNQAKKQLKKLIQPFLLRRTKTQVLAELPSRTEITLSVELSEAEAAFYEALRQKAISSLADSEATAGTKHLQVLAAIMKLRRACCHSRLVLPESPLSSSKLEVFGEVLEELLEDNHKALVFSQFVDHLHIIRDYLDEKNISYQYLDGSTPAKQRQIRVNAFQSGQGDVFLISLKAGGTGLNLTAADYVIHTDPWWNPAVEDQASDRAHRLGQKRPVTIYRLVTKGTIEEKIVQLHHHKRDLADSLLEGTEMSGKLSTDELLRLMME
ncbi:MAG: DEAD/DEAH box helicase, partial [Jaaginema sp. PMC 1079.18]|nr:DEAD/DEAH box helicase [Jaaginema sp. PMC 1079.18]